MAWFKIKPIKANEPQLKEQLTKSKGLNKVEEFYPQTLNEAEIFARILLLQKPIILNFSKTNLEQRRRIIDFTCGIAFVLNINIDKISKDIYHLTFNRK